MRLSDKDAHSVYRIDAFIATQTESRHGRLFDFASGCFARRGHELVEKGTELWKHFFERPIFPLRVGNPQSARSHGFLKHRLLANPPKKVLLRDRFWTECVDQVGCDQLIAKFGCQRTRVPNRQKSGKASRC